MEKTEKISEEIGQRISKFEENWTHIFKELNEQKQDKNKEMASKFIINNQTAEIQ